MDTGSWADWFSGSMSALAVVVALGGYWLSNHQRELDAKDLKRAAADRVAVKLTGICNGIHGVRKHLNTQAATQPLIGPDGPSLWRNVQPLLGLDDTAPFFEANEVSIFISAKKPDYLMDLLLLSKRYAVLLKLMREYEVRRDALLALAPVPSEFLGQVGTVHMTMEQYARIRPYEIQVEQLIKGLVAAINEDWYLAIKAMNAFGPMMKEVLADPGYISLGVPLSNLADPPEGQA